MIVPDDVVIEALLKDARRFKSKWELRTNEPTRNKPNLKFLNRTLSEIVKSNRGRMRQPKKTGSCEPEFCLSSEREKKEISKNTEASSDQRPEKSKCNDSSKKRSKKFKKHKSTYRARSRSPRKSCNKEKK